MALVKAQQLIFEAKKKDARSDDERAYFQWFIQSLNAHEYDNSFGVELLRSYEGTYDRFEVLVKEGRLYLNDFVGRTFLLKPITPTLFLGSDWFQVEFLSSNERITRMRMMGKPGWLNIHNRLN